MMTKAEVLAKIKELEAYLEALDNGVGFEDDNIFLLSIEEYEKYKNSIPEMENCWWWLRSAGRYSYYAVDVFDNSLVDIGGDVNYKFVAVRPALKYAYLKPFIVFEPNNADYFIWNHTVWKIIDKDNKIAIAVTPIAFDMFDKNTNNYEDSYIRKWLINWYVEALLNNA